MPTPSPCYHCCFYVASQMKRKAAKQGALAPLALKDLTEASAEDLAIIPSPATGTLGTLTPPRDFNLMFQTAVSVCGACWRCRSSLWCVFGSLLRPCSDSVVVVSTDAPTCQADFKR